MISDFVKGKKKYEYPHRILKGIDLHRDIDQFTDMHPVNKIAAKFFRQDYGLYSSAFIDVAYDHFLAVALAVEGDEAFREFTIKVYQQIENFISILPAKFRDLFPYMKKHNWLYNYQFAFGIKNSFEGLAHRARYLTEGITAYAIFQHNYEEIKDCFDQFFPELRAFALKKYSDIQ